MRGLMCSLVSGLIWLSLLINPVLGNTKTEFESKTSWYGPHEHGRLMANGHRFNQWGLTAAHKTLPFGTILRVTNPSNGKSVRVTVTDRGPYIKGRSLDLSRSAARILHIEKQGVAVLRVRIIQKPPPKQ